MDKRRHHIPLALRAAIAAIMLLAGAAMFPLTQQVRAGSEAAVISSAGDGSF